MTIKSNILIIYAFQLINPGTLTFSLYLSGLTISNIYNIPIISYAIYNNNITFIEKLSNNSI